jgi:hypothetical protein
LSVITIITPLGPTQPSRLALVARLRDNSRYFYGTNNATSLIYAS